MHFFSHFKLVTLASSIILFKQHYVVVMNLFVMSEFGECRKGFETVADVAFVHIGAQMRSQVFH